MWKPSLPLIGISSPCPLFEVSVILGLSYTLGKSSNLTFQLHDVSASPSCNAKQPLVHFQQTRDESNFLSGSCGTGCGSRVRVRLSVRLICCRSALLRNIHKSARPADPRFRHVWGQLCLCLVNTSELTRLRWFDGWWGYRVRRTLSLLRLNKWIYSSLFWPVPAARFAPF
jgi:hypothetical protein